MKTFGNSAHLKEEEAKIEHIVTSVLNTRRRRKIRKIKLLMIVIFYVITFLSSILTIILNIQLIK